MTPDETVPDTAMATGNDEGEPGERRDGGPLTSAEKQLLKKLKKSGGSAEPAVEDSPDMAAAAADDAPLPALAPDGGGDQGDDLAPEFTDR